MSFAPLKIWWNWQPNWSMIWWTSSNPIDQLPRIPRLTRAPIEKLRRNLFLQWHYELQACTVCSAPLACKNFCPIRIFSIGQYFWSTIGKPWWGYFERSHVIFPILLYSLKESSISDVNLLYNYQLDTCIWSKLWCLYVLVFALFLVFSLDGEQLPIKCKVVCSDKTIKENY